MAAAVQKTHTPLASHRAAAARDDAHWQPSGHANVSAVARKAKTASRIAARARRTAELWLISWATRRRLPGPPTVALTTTSRADSVQTVMFAARVQSLVFAALPARRATSAPAAAFGSSIFFVET